MLLIVIIVGIIVIWVFFDELVDFGSDIGE